MGTVPLAVDLVVMSVWSTRISAMVNALEAWCLVVPRSALGLREPTGLRTMSSTTAPLVTRLCVLTKELLVMESVLRAGSSVAPMPASYQRTKTSIGCVMGSVKE